MYLKKPNEAPSSELSAITPREVASALGLSTKTVLRMLNDGRIPGVKVGRRWMIASTTLENLVALGSESKTYAGQRADRNESPQKDRFYSRWSYERLLLHQPHVETVGLFRLGATYFIVCPNLTETFAEDRTPISHWFDRNRVAGSPTKIVAERPQGSVPVPHRNIEEIVDLSGDPLTSFELNYVIAVRLGLKFPFIGLSVEHSAHGDTRNPRLTYIAYVHHELSETEIAHLHEVIGTFAFGADVEIRIKSVLDTPEKEQPRKKHPPGRSHDLNLILTRHLPKTLSHELRTKWEEDEEYWLSARKLLWGPDAAHIDPLPQAFRENHSKCLIDAAVFPAHNIRTYLSLFNKATFILPLQDNTGRFLESINISEKDLVRLSEIGRVQFIAPQSLDRYSPHLVSRLCETAPNSILFSRRLAVATLLDSRRRNPFLYPQGAIDERHRILRAFIEVANAERDTTSREILYAFIHALKLAWSQTEHRLEFQGAMASLTAGLGTFVGEVFYRLRGKDIRIESHVSMAPVEWAGTLNATLFPINTDDFSAQAISEVCASVYSGVHSNIVAERFGDIETVLNGILTPINDADVFDLCDAFKDDAAKQLYEIVNKIVLSSASLDDLNEKIREFNRKVHRFENKLEFIKSLDLGALAGLMGTPALTGNMYTVIPWAGWLLLRLAATNTELLPIWLAKRMELASSAMLVSPQDAVFVARLKRALK